MMSQHASSTNSDSSLSASHRHRRRKHDRDGDHPKNSRGTKSFSHAAPSDYAQLRSHFRFVLPDDDDDDDGSNREKYGSTWQQRMVQHYHSHLYKEYVLADLSRVAKGGPVGLRWRTEDEVKSGRGFRTCGNLACASPSQTGSAAEEEYIRRARAALGVGVAEQGGNIPTGVLLPSEEASDAIELYLRSCEREERRSREKRERLKHRRRHRPRDPSRGEDDSSLGEESKRRESKEQKRLSRVPHGVGLHDYEVDFAYVEENQNKRELVKVRLCLRCAPLIFSGKHAATKARLARERAAREAIASRLESGTEDVSGDCKRGNRHENSGNTEEENSGNNNDNAVKRRKSHERRQKTNRSSKSGSNSLSTSSDDSSSCSSDDRTASLPSTNREKHATPSKNHVKKRQKKS